MEDERIAELEARLTDLENRFHDEVDEKLIGGLRKAKDTYDDNIAFDDFKGKYGEQIGKIILTVQFLLGSTRYNAWFGYICCGVNHVQAFYYEQTTIGNG